MASQEERERLLGKILLDGDFRRELLTSSDSERRLQSMGFSEEEARRIKGMNDKQLEKLKACLADSFPVESWGG